ncbi:hypothetical protein Taro_047353 [Colocasia esculenta]|uniref:Uncharacterized protein n=1 Tax=Colocasia esculenta TaxID=4460 RepID=A0A843WV48_COLES|nr:hypothetical protein [Colocasia esculenta]
MAVTVVYFVSYLALTRREGEASQQRQGARQAEEMGAVVVVHIASSVFPLSMYVTLGPFRVSGSMGGDRENRVLGVGRGSGSRGRYIECCLRGPLFPKLYVLYLDLKNRFGWGWDDDKHMSVPGDQETWEDLVANALGAIDGCHISAKVSQTDQPRYRN